MPLRDPYLRDFDFSRVIAIAQAARGEDPFGHQAQFVQLMRLAESVAGFRVPDYSGFDVPR
jgi:hypothetical protein